MPIFSETEDDSAGLRYRSHGRRPEPNLLMFLHMTFDSPARELLNRAVALGALGRMEEALVHVDRALEEARSKKDHQLLRLLPLTALQRVQFDCERAGHSTHWKLYACCELMPMLCGIRPPHFDQLSKQLGFESSSDAKHALSSVKRSVHEGLITLLSKLPEK